MISPQSVKELNSLDNKDCIAETNTGFSDGNDKKEKDK
jgi:hypothetical protein